MQLPLFLSLTFMTLALSASAQTTRVWNSNDIHWQEINSDGSKYAVLEGDRSKPGPFTYAFFLPSGVWEQPHTHTGTARVCVISGTLLLGDGPRLIKANARAMPSGTFFLVAANAPHWEGARGDTLIIGIGIGPWKTALMK